MLTILDIDDDVLLVIRKIAQREGISVGKLLSDLARQALTQQAERVTRNNVPLFPHQPEAVEITLELVNQIRDDLG